MVVSLRVPFPWNFRAWERGSYGLNADLCAWASAFFSIPSGDILGTQLHESQQRVASHSLVPVFFQPDLFSAAILLSFQET